MIKTKDRKIYKVDLLIKDNGEHSDGQLINNNPCLADKLITDSRNYKVENFCFNYALNNEHIWGCNALNLLTRNYKHIPIYKAKKGDIITFFKKRIYSGDVEHYARICKTNGTLKGTTIRSKWGSLGIYETDLYHLPEEYGGYMEVWTKR